MPFPSPALVYPPQMLHRQRRAQRFAGLGYQIYRNGSGRRYPYNGRPGQQCPVPTSEMIVAGAVWDPVNCRWIPPSTSPTQPTPTSTATTPVPAGFPTDQIFMAPDGSQWVYSAAQKQWVNVGTPYNLGQPPQPAAPVSPPSSSTLPEAATTPPPAAAAPVSVTVAPGSTYQSVIDFATQSSLISGIPNWIVGLLAIGGYKLLDSYASKGRR